MLRAQEWAGRWHTGGRLQRTFMLEVYYHPPFIQEEVQNQSEVILLINSKVMHVQFIFKIKVTARFPLEYKSDSYYWKQF